jgi:hypothetical protein
MSGSILQLLLRGEEDTHIISESFDAYRPFRQVYKKAVAFATQWIDIDARLPSTKVYGETLRFRVPRKGDILKGIMIGFKVRRAAGQSYFPGLQLIREASVYAGRQTIETIPSEYMLLRHYTQEDTDEAATTSRLTTFQAEETQGMYKTMYVKIPFFFEKTPLPLIAVQNQHIDIEVEFGKATLALDPSYEPLVDIYLEYAYIDDDERRYYTSNEHTLLIERLQTQDEQFQMRQSQINKLFSTQQDALGEYVSVVGSGENRNISQGDSIALVNNPEWTGRTEIVYTVESPSKFDFRGRFLLPTTGTFGMKYATYTSNGVNYGYTVEFQTVNNVFGVYIKRNGVVIASINNTKAYTDYRTTVSGNSTSSTDVSAQVAAGEAWMVFHLVHDLDTFNGIQLSLQVEGYDEGGYFGDIDPVNNSVDYVYTFVEGYNPIDTVSKQTTYSFFADSSFNVTLTETQYIINKVEILPLTNNLKTLQSRLFFRGPIRYLLWIYSKGGVVDEETWGKFSTASDERNTLERHNILHSARLLLNGQDKTGWMDSVFYNVVEMARVFKKPLPTGVHCISFAMDPLTMAPNGSANFSQLQSILLVQNLKSYSDTITSENDLLSLDETEVLANGKDFDTISVFAVGWNVLRIANGAMALGYL